MRRLLIALMLVLMVAFSNSAQAQSTPQAHPGQPVKTIKIGKVRFSYYDVPETVAASATFYVNGSEVTAHNRNFVGLMVYFGNRGKNLITPSVVQFMLDATTYRDGCKYKDNHHLIISVDNQILISSDLSAQQISDTGKRCIELYTFEMPYEQFVQLVNARKVEMRLGSKELKFTEDYLKALRTMRDGIGRY